MKNGKVSVIVPVYNAEKTLPMCLGNLLNQTYRNMEFILINDCSKDNSYKVLLDAEAYKPEQVLVINLEQNLGAGGARNVGLSYASGDYVGFVDSDDLIDPTMYEKLVTKLEEGDYDMVDCGYLDEKTGNAIVMIGEKDTGRLDGKKRSNIIANGGYFVTHLFKRHLLEGIVFREHSILEDMETLMMIDLKAESVGIVAEALYKYCYYENSFSHADSKNAAKYQKASADAIKAIGEGLLTMPGYDQVQEAVEYSILELYKRAYINTMLANGQIPASIQKAWQNDLKLLRSRYVKIDPMKNCYVLEKFGRDDLEILKL